MKTILILAGFAVLLTFAVILVASLFLTAPPVSAESIPNAHIVLPDLQQDGSFQEGWNKFWQEFKVWLEQLAQLFAQMPLLGPLIAEILRFIGASNIWLCGALIFIAVFVGGFLIRR